MYTLVTDVIMNNAPVNGLVATVAALLKIDSVFLHGYLAMFAYSTAPIPPTRSTVQLYCALHTNSSTSWILVSDR